MKHYEFNYTLPATILRSWTERVRHAQDLFLHARNGTYEDGYSFINAPFDNDIVLPVLGLIKSKQELDPRMLIVIGIGGSNLGAKAVHEFLQGVYYNDQNPTMSCYFVDSLDTDALTVVVQRMQQVLAQGQEIIINVISKSGTTTETSINFNLFLGHLKQYRPDTYHQYIVVTSDTGSLLAEVAHKERFSLLSIPPAIGGRYSVFTAVGLFPLGMLGVDVEQLCKGAQEVVDNVLHDLNHDATEGAYVSYDQCLRGKNIHDMFVFGSELTSLGLWYRQLVGESLGKDKKIGITPTASVGSTDLHSVGQLYLGGPGDKYVTFVSTNQKHDLTFVVQPELYNLIPVIKKNSVDHVMQAIIEGTKKAYSIDELPFESLYIQKNALSCGQVLQLLMMRIVYMAHLFEVNPFDQPHVELYKSQTREILRYE